MGTLGVLHSVGYLIHGHTDILLLLEAIAIVHQWSSQAVIVKGAALLIVKCTYGSWLCGCVKFLGFWPLLLLLEAIPLIRERSNILHVYIHLLQWQWTLWTCDVFGSGVLDTLLLQKLLLFGSGLWSRCTYDLVNAYTHHLPLSLLLSVYF
jgi:hypothetical protein